MKKNLKGFTLVELIIVMALMSILMLMVGLIMKPISQVFADTTAYTEDRYVMDGMAQYIDESLKYADKVWIHYDYDSQAVDGTWVETNLANYMGVAKEDIQVIAIINNNMGSAGFDAADFTNNSGNTQMGRIYKSAYVNGARKVWLVGGEAFYGGGSYFVNLEGEDTDSIVGHYDPGDLRYTIYSLEPKVYEENTYDDNLSMVATFRDNTREDIQSLPSNALIKNYSEKSVHFVNNPKHGDADFSGKAWKTPLDGALGATASQGNTLGGVDGAEHFANEGYNIFIYYTVPK